jgi:ketosteroid isomerase-like protein
MEMQTEWSAEELALKEQFTANSYSGEKPTAYSESDVDAASTDYFTDDAISCAAGHPAMVGHAVLRAWHERRVRGYNMNVATRCQHANVVGELAIVGGIFRISRDAQDGVPAFEHAGRWLSVLKKVDGRWRTWRDMDTPSPDAEELFTVPVDVSLGWVRAPLPDVS